MERLRLELGQGFFSVGENCWRVANAQALSFLIDAQSYYLALLSALRQAQEFVLILAWDIDTRVQLNPESSSRKDNPTLGEALMGALDSNPKLNVYILCWDFAMVYALERQFFRRVSRTFKHPRIHFMFDGFHPFVASQHQKLVIIDDQLAFAGGIDLCLGRWDTRHHLASDRRRVDHSGREHNPFHDIQVVMSGEAASCLAELGKDRWFQATGEQLPVFRATRKIWPFGVRQEFSNLPVAISRTYYLAEGNQKIREIERMLVDSLHAARRYVYIESQYFTSSLVAHTIIERVGRKDSPEFVVLLPRYNSGWIEECTMGVLRNRLIRKLRRADKRKRVRFYFPSIVSESGKKIPISLHSKILIVDERIMHTGSANLSNRSMGLDTECGVTLFGEEGTAISDKIREIRDSLVAEHLGVSKDQIELEIRKSGSLFRSLDHISRVKSSRILEEFPDSINSIQEKLTPDESILDPDQPIEEDAFFCHFVPKNKERFYQLKNSRLMRRVILLIGISLLLSNPILRDYIHPIEVYQTILSQFRPLPMAAVICLFFLLGTFCRISTDILIFTTGLVNPYDRSWFYALTGLVISATLAYGIGNWISRDDLSLEKIHRTRKTQFWTFFLIHMNLVAPFSVVSFRAGRMRIAFSPYLIGTLAGELARVLLVSSYAFIFRETILNSTLFYLLLFGLSTLLAVGISRWITYRFLPSYGGRSLCPKRGR